MKELLERRARIRRAVRDLREWADVESLPAQEEFEAALEEIRQATRWRKPGVSGCWSLIVVIAVTVLIGIGLWCAVDEHYAQATWYVALAIFLRMGDD